MHAYKRFDDVKANHMIKWQRIWVGRGIFRCLKLLRSSPRCCRFEVAEEVEENLVPYNPSTPLPKLALLALRALLVTS